MYLWGGVEEVLRSLKMLNISKKVLIIILITFEKMWKYEFGNRFISIGLEKSAVGAARVVEKSGGIDATRRKSDEYYTSISARQYQ